MKFWLGFIVVVYLIAALAVRSSRPRSLFRSVTTFTSFMTIAFGLLGVDEVVKAVNLNVILFLIRMFSLVSLAMFRYRDLVIRGS